MSAPTGIVIRSSERNAVWFNELRPLIKLHSIINTPEQIRWLAFEFQKEFGNCLDVNLLKIVEQWDEWSEKNDPEDLHKKIFTKLIEIFFNIGETDQETGLV